MHAGARGRKTEEREKTESFAFGVSDKNLTFTMA